MGISRRPGASEPRKSQEAYQPVVCRNPSVSTEKAEAGSPDHPAGETQPSPSGDTPWEGPGLRRAHRWFGGSGGLRLSENPRLVGRDGNHWGPGRQTMTSNAEAGGARREAPPRLLGIRTEHLLVLAATMAGLAVRLWVGLRTEVWLDEANSVLIALAPFRELAAVLAPDSSPPLYYLVLKVWLFFAPLDPFWLRIPSLILGCGAIPVAWWVGARMDRPRTGILVAWLLSFSPLHVHYSEEIRMYAMLALLALLFYFAVFHVLRGTGAILPGILSGAALAYTHYYGLVLAGVGILAAFVVMPGRRRKVALCGGWMALAFLPWVPVFLDQLGNPHHLSWIRPFWERYPGAVGIFRSLQAFLPGGMTYSFVPLDGFPYQALIVAFGAFPFLLLASRTAKAPRPLRWPVGLPLLVAGGTLLVVVLESYLGSPAYLPGRSDVVVLPLFLLALAAAVSRLGSRTAGVFVLGWISLGLGQLWMSQVSLRQEGNAEMAAAVDSAGCSTLIATGYTYAPMLFYQLVGGRGVVVAPFPIDVGEHPGNMDAESYTPADLARDAYLLSQAYPPGDGLCILSPGETLSGALAEAFPAGTGRAVERGVYVPSTMRGTPYVLTVFSGEGS